jgi:hypothetical protein
VTVLGDLELEDELSFIASCQLELYCGVWAFFNKPGLEGCRRREGFWERGYPVLPHLSAGVGGHLNTRCKCRSNEVCVLKMIENWTFISNSVYVYIAWDLIRVLGGEVVPYLSTHAPHKVRRETTRTTATRQHVIEKETHKSS